MRHRVRFPRSPRLAAALVGGALLTAPVLAWAWGQSALINVKVHDHTFDRVSIESAECTVHAKLHFAAPASGYDSGARERNYHRFKARIRLTNDQAIVSPIFGNPRPGRRMYTFSYDTSAEGCWAKEEHKLKGVDIEACRGRRCEPEPFK
ncbi:MAG: hypothetical protein GX607_14670 [Myxococcales bacterium]|nr:hypothetical protein [Myxococcales bacterium]